MEFVLTHKNIDNTSDYTILIPDNMTINDFIDEILKYNITLKQTHQQERGSIKIPPYIVICTYDGQMVEFRDPFFDYKNCIIKNACAKGGWGLMDYYLTI